MPEAHGTVGKLDFAARGATERTRLLHDSESIDSLPEEPSQLSARSGRFFEHVAEGVQDHERQKFKREAVRYISFAWAVICSACAGSITAYSLYGPLFQTRLLYTQYQVNVVSVVAAISLYLPVPIFGYLIDRYSPRPLLLFAGITFGFGYLLAAFTYKSGPPRDTTAENGWPFGVMVIAFVTIGMATSSMQMSSMSTCAKNFGKSRFKGIAVALPTAAFGLSGFWESQVGAFFLFENNEQSHTGDLDVFRYFIFLGSLLAVAGIIGSVVVHIVDEEEIIEEAIEELSRSGLLDAGEFFPSRRHSGTYGTVQQNHVSEQHERQVDDAKTKVGEDAKRKALLLKSETRLFVTDPTMWLLTAGVFLIIGPGECFINNLGTLIGTLYPEPSQSPNSPLTYPPTSPATHVSIVAISNTAARLLAGLASDLLSPSTPITQRQRNRGPASLTSSLASLDPLGASTDSVPVRRRSTVSRIPMLIICSIVLSIGAVMVASGAVQNHAADRLWVVSAFFGTGYGAVFSLVPIVIQFIWGVENFGTNFGIVATAAAFGTAVYGILYAAEYESGIRNDIDFGGKCYGVRCYRVTFGVIAVSVWIACVLWILAWRGPSGWKRRGINV